MCQLPLLVNATVVRHVSLQLSILNLVTSFLGSSLALVTYDPNLQHPTSFCRTSPSTTHPRPQLIDKCSRIARLRSCLVPLEMITDPMRLGSHVNSHDLRWLIQPSLRNASCQLASVVRKRVSLSVAFFVFLQSLHYLDRFCNYIETLPCWSSKLTLGFRIAGPVWCLVGPFFSTAHVVRSG